MTLRFDSDRLVTFAISGKSSPSLSLSQNINLWISVKSSIQACKKPTCCTFMAEISGLVAQSPLSRAQREMLAVVVSGANNCEYCIRHHSVALNHYWKDDGRITILLQNRTKAGLSKIDLALCEYAEILTINPSSSATAFTMLKSLNVSDIVLHDASVVISYFNFVNRIVLGLDIQIEADGGGGFNY